MTYRQPFIAVVCAALLSQAAYASDSAMQSPSPIGAIGQPGMMEPASPTAQAPVATPPGQMVVPEKPLLVIRFNQRRVYFDRALRQAVASAEKTRAGVVYHVVAFMPPSQDNHQNARVSQDTMANQQAVVNELQNQGIPPARIRTSTGFENVQSPEVRIFVN